MRTIGQLYQIVLEHFDDPPNWAVIGICDSIAHCANHRFITNAEYHKLRPHFFKQRPTIFSKWWWNWNYKAFTNTREQFWWRDNSRGAIQRKLFLAYLAKKYASVPVPDHSH